MRDDQIEPGMEKYAAAAEWQQTHKRDDFAGDTYPITGFGPEGLILLWLPPAKAETRFRRRNGRFVREEHESPLHAPEIEDLRTRAKLSFKSPEPGKFTVGPAFFDYTIQVIRMAYAVTDEELRMLMSGRRWHRPMIVHVAGGIEQVRAMQQPRDGVIPFIPD